MNVPCLIELDDILHSKIRLWLEATFSSKKSPQIPLEFQNGGQNSKMAAILMTFLDRSERSIFLFLVF